MKQSKQFVKEYWLFSVSFLAVLIILELLVKRGIVPSFIIPAPTGVVMAIVENWQVLLGQHLVATLEEFFIGLVITVIGGVLLAVTMFFFKPVERIMYPAVVISQMIPIIALSPIFILWFGYTIWSKVAVTVLISFFPIVVSTYDGLKACDKEYIELFRAMGASRKQIFTKLQVPMALPSFFSGFKMAVVFALVGATIGEWLGASEGLGYYSRRMSGNLNADGVFAAIVVLTVAGIVLFGVARWIEQFVLRKYRQERLERNS